MTHIALLQISFVHNRLRNAGILQDMLPDICVHAKDTIRGLCLRGGLRIRTAVVGYAIALLEVCLGHFVL
jgi:hypothetical protein